MNETDKTVTKVVRGVDMKLLISNRSLELCSRMNYETENLDFIDQIKEGELLLDLGACEGRFSIYAALKGIRVLAFEPEANNYGALRKNIELNELTSSQLSSFQYAVGESEEAGIMNIGQPWAGGHQKVIQHASVRGDLDFQFKESQEVRVVSLDNFLKEAGGIVPDYIKIDIDGSEIPFLKGAVNTLQHSDLKAIIFELDKNDQYFPFILNELKKAGLHPSAEYQVPNEKSLFNIIFNRS